MTNEEKILAAIEEVGNQLNELKKTLGQNKEKTEIDLSPIIKKLSSIDEPLKELNRRQYTCEYGINQVSESLKNLRSRIEEKRSEVVHRVIEIKQPQWWIIGIASYFILSFGICFWLIEKNITLNEIIVSMEANDLKYRYLKLKGYELNDLRKEIRNTTELIHSMDFHYSKKKDEIKNYVIRREEELRQLFEANEIAKQKEIEARKAIENATSLKKKYNQ